MGINMDINALIEFPGILITIGVCLILISVIIIIIAYKAETKVVDATKLSVQNNNFEMNKEENVINDEINDINNNIETIVQVPENNAGIDENINENVIINEEITNEVTEEKVDEENDKLEIPQVDAKILDIKGPEKEDITEILPTINAFDLEFNDNNKYEPILNKKQEKIEDKIKKEIEEEEDIELL